MTNIKYTPMTEYIIRQVVDRQHVSMSNVGVLRAVRRAFRKGAFMQMHRRMRKRIYRQAIKQHQRNKALFMAVALGDFQRRERQQ